MYSIFLKLAGQASELESVGKDSGMPLPVWLALIAIVLIAIVAGFLLWRTVINAEREGDPGGEASCPTRAPVGDQRKSATTESMEETTLSLEDTQGTLRDFNSVETINTVDESQGPNRSETK